MIEEEEKDSPNNNLESEVGAGTQTRSGGKQQTFKGAIAVKRKGKSKGNMMQAMEMMEDDKVELSNIKSYSNPFVKVRYLYKPFVPLPNLVDYLQQLIEVRIFKPYLTKFNKGVIKRNFYGNDIYTSDSDPVCILQHMGIIALTDEEP
jgi:hypothetical protein